MPRVPPGSAGIVAFAALGVFLVRLALALTVIPPWQHPDEPAEVAVAEVFRSRLTDDPSPDRGREAEILRSLATHQWWRHYGTETPSTIPERFVALTGSTVFTLGVSVEASNIPRLYYTGVAALLSALPRLPVVNDMYIMRGLSALFAVLTLWVAWRGARLCLGSAGGALVIVLLGLHPQFVLVSTAAGPDAFVNLAGACLWWQGARAILGAALLPALGGVWAAAIVGAMADRMGVPLLASACAVSILATAGRVAQRSALRLAGGAVLLLLATLWLLERSWQIFGMYELLDRLWPIPEARTWEFVWSFASVLFETWWAAIGWLRYPTPGWWFLAPALLVGVAAAGVGRILLRGDDPRMRRVVYVALLVVAVQLAAVCWVYFRIAAGPQGRHLFPSLVPSLVLLWIGLQELTPIHHRPSLAAAVAVTLALFDSAVWAFVGITAYAS